MLRDQPPPERRAALLDLAADGPLLLDAPDELGGPGRSGSPLTLTFLERLSLERAARAIFTDSEQVREEAALCSACPADALDGAGAPAVARDHDRGATRRGTAGRARGPPTPWSRNFALVRLAP